MIALARLPEAKLTCRIKLCLNGSNLKNWIHEDLGYQGFTSDEMSGCGAGNLLLLRGSLMGPQSLHNLSTVDRALVELAIN